MATGGRADLAHLSRRAGFGATPAELDVWAAKGYEAVVEELLNPEEAPEFEADLMDRYFPRRAHPHGRGGVGCSAWPTARALWRRR